MIDYSIIGKRFGNLTVIALDHITHSIAEWSKLTGVNHETLRYRVNHNNFDDIDEYLNKED